MRVADIGSGNDSDYTDNGCKWAADHGYEGGCLDCCFHECVIVVMGESFFDTWGTKRQHEDANLNILDNDTYFVYSIAK